MIMRGSYQAEMCYTEWYICYRTWYRSI